MKRLNPLLCNPTARLSASDRFIPYPGARMIPGAPLRPGNPPSVDHVPVGAGCSDIQGRQQIMRRIDGFQDRIRTGNFIDKNGGNDCKKADQQNRYRGKDRFEVFSELTLCAGILLQDPNSSLSSNTKSQRLTLQWTLKIALFSSTSMDSMGLCHDL